MRAVVKFRIALYTVFGFLLLGIYLVAIPTRSGHRPSPENVCNRNLRYIDGAKQQWALENQSPSNAVPGVADLEIYLPPNAEERNRTLHCPSGGKYTINFIGLSPTCSIPNHLLK